MSISRQNLTVVIVTFKSEEVIHNCIKSISDQIKIIIIENSNDLKFKKNIEKEYNNVECILSPKNLGMGPGNNLGLKYVKTDYAIILNPDVILGNNAIQEIINESKNINSFAVLAPLSDNSKFPNYKLSKKNSNKINISSPFKVRSVDGYAMLLNLKKINQLKGFNEYSYFDENFFMYLENDDFCKRLIESGENIYIIPNSRIKHLGGKAVNHIYAHEVELSRNWHWIWSKFYYNKKHFGIFIALFNGSPKFISATFKYLLYLLINNHKKKQIYSQRMMGFICAVLGKPSYYRPKINS